MVPEVLPLAVPRGHLGMILPPSLPVVAVPGPPFLQAIAAHLSVLGISSQSAPVIVTAPPPLASRLRADRLSGTVLRGLECLLTIAAAPFFHASVVAPISWSFRPDDPLARWKDLETDVESLPRPRRWVVGAAATGGGYSGWSALVSCRSGRSFGRRHRRQNRCPFIPALTDPHPTPPRRRRRDFATAGVAGTKVLMTSNLRRTQDTAAPMKQSSPPNNPRVVSLVATRNTVGG